MVPFFPMLSFGNFLRMLDSSPNLFMHSIAGNSCKVDFYMIKFLLKFWFMYKLYRHKLYRHNLYRHKLYRSQIVSGTNDIGHKWYRAQIVSAIICIGHKLYRLPFRFPLFPIKLWNMYESILADKEITNNHVEGMKDL